MRLRKNKIQENRLARTRQVISRLHGALVLTVSLATLACLCGCSGIVSRPSTQAAAPPQTYSISGTIGPVAGGSGATVTLSGAANATSTADSSGNFTFSGLANGTYTVTPTHAGYTFNPSSLNVTVNGANINTGMNFTATALTFNLSGTISPAATGSGAKVALSGAATTTTTADSGGNYTFPGLANGTYAVTPSRTGYAFNPSTQTATVTGGNVTGVNFTAQASPTFSISGTISPTIGGSAATVTLSGAAAATAITDGAGNYMFTGLGNGTYTVTPTNVGFAFAPGTQSVTVSSANVPGVNFTASAQVTHSVALTWIASSTPTVTGYNVYRSTMSGTAYVKISSSLVLAPLVSYTDATVLNSTTYYYVTTAVDASNVESAFSNEVAVAIP